MLGLQIYILGLIYSWKRITMDFRKLQYFISVAECKSFTGAAKCNYISQPSLSRQIAELESELGVQLFVRSKHNVAITAEGAKLLEYAKGIIRQSYEMVTDAHKHGPKGEGTLRIGYPGYWEYNYVVEIINNLSKNNPNLNITFVREYQNKLLQKLKLRECDVIFTCMAPWESMPLIEWKKILKAPLCLVTTQENPLASKGYVKIEELHDENFIMIQRSENSIINDIIVNYCNENGFSPNISPYQPSNIQDLMLMIAAGKGVTIAVKWVKSWCPELCFLSTEPHLPEIEFGIAYRKDDQAHSFYLSSFLEVVDSIKPMFSH